MTTSLWLQDCDPFAAAAPLPATAEVAIVGGGIAGVSTALHLAAAGLQPVLLEADAISCRASGRNDGQLLLGLGEHYHRIVSQFGADKAARLWQFIARNHDALRAAIAAHGIDCDLQQQGGLRLAETSHEAEELRQAAGLLAQRQLPHQLLDAGEVASVLPAARHFHGVLRLPGEAIVQQARVTAIRGGAGDFTVQLADGRTLRAAAVVHCTSTLARELDGTGFLSRVVFPFRGQVLATAPLPADVAAQFPPCAMSSNFCYEYFRMHKQRFVIGGMRWSVRGEELGIVDDQSHNSEVTANLRAYVDRHFPCLRDVDFPAVWTGIMAGTPDGLPLLGGLPGQPGVFALQAFNGYGLSFAFHGARCLAQMIVDGQCDDDAAELFAPRRFA